MGEYDRTMKSLVDNDPEALTRFILHEWQRQQETVLPEVKITAVKQLNSEFQSTAKKSKSEAKQSTSESESEELVGDSVLLVEGPDRPLYLIELEFQSNLHPYMPIRSLEYLARAMKKHWKVCSNLPVIAVVIYLFDKEGMPLSPLVWPAPAEQATMVFHYVSIQMKDLPREAILALQEPTLWPLALLTAEPVDCILVEQMFAELVGKKLYDTLPIGYTVASWLLHGDDFDWLVEEGQKMHEFFEDSPGLDWIKEIYAQKEQRKAEQKILEERQKNEQRMLTMNREMVVALVSERFPTLLRMAKAHIRMLKQPELFQQVILRLSLARDVNEAQDVLLSLLEKEEEEADIPASERS